MNYIITGGTGFIGTHLTNLIKERYDEQHKVNLEKIYRNTDAAIIPEGVTNPAK